MKANGGDRVVAGRQFEQSLAARATFHMQSVRSSPPEASVLPSGESTTERTQSAWPSSCDLQLAGGGIPNRHAVSSRRGGDRLAVGRDGDAGDDGGPLVVVGCRTR